MLRKAIAWPFAGLLAVGTIGTPAWAASDAAALGVPFEVPLADSAVPVPAPPPPVARKEPARDCDCQSPYRDYPKAETPEVRALFEAARANDEAAFTAALARVPHPGDYADDGRPLLHVLLMPPRGLRSKHVYWDMPKDEAARLRDEHRAALPARTRMLAALLATKPALNDATYQSRRTALQLALLYGSPQIVDMLLAAGADPNQAGDEGRKPLEFLLDRDFEFAVRMTYLPRLVDRPDMARMVQALLKAGAQRPFQGLDDAKPGGASALTDAAGEPRRMADFLSWNPLVELTEGGDVLRAFAATGTRPAFDNELSPLALAAYTGNAGAVPALMELVPRTVPATGYGEKGVRDVWLDAAQAAVIGGHPEIAVQLLQAGMPYAQRGPLTGSSNPLFLRVEGGDRPIMNLAAQRGDTVTLRRLVELGAPVEGDAGERHGNTPLAEAVARRRPEAARILLAAGADPALQRDNYDSRSALEQAVTAGDTALLRELLKAARPDTLQALMRHPTRSPVLLALKQPGADGLAMLRLWVDAGFDLKTLDADAIRQAVSSRNEALAIYLIDAGVPVNPRPPAAAGGDGASQDHADEPPLLAAAILRQDAIVDRLLAKGADPAGLASDGQSALYWLIAQGNQAGLDRLLRGGARLDDPRLPRAPAPYALINAAAGSGDIALARRVAQATGQGLDRACLPDGGEFRLLDGPGYFAGLQQLGFNGGSADCGAPLGRRVLAALLQGRELIVARRDTAVDVLRRLKAGGTDLQAPQEDGETPLNAAIRLGRKDLADALLAAGADPDAPDLQGRSPAWTALETGQPEMLALLATHKARFTQVAAPPGQDFAQILLCQAAPAFNEALAAQGVSLQPACPAQAAAPHGRGVSKAVSKSAAPQRLPGHYYLQGVREVGSELVLSEDGSFDYLMSYGAVDISASGAWRSDGKQVYLDTPPLQPFSALAGVRAGGEPARPENLTVRVYYQGRLVRADVAMSSASDDYAGAPRESEGEDGVSAPIASAGELRALAVFVPLPSGARWHFVDVSKLDPAARAIRIDLALPQAASASPLHISMTLREDGSLVETRGGRVLRYAKE
ncbi:ankyrin repeat domain-containing protein [Achromobacter sp. 413638]|uniref:ankyrin repeat domain-containing protein n=1 Tax=Achromobacter sp. 413638 TaxID=3342385 RepID=UPI00370CF66D